MAWNLVCLLLLINSTPLTTWKTPMIHHCQVEWYKENVTIRNCSNTPQEIVTARCRGQCYSDDYLLYDWQYAPTHYRHVHRIDCCLPIKTKIGTIHVSCDNNTNRTIKYPIVAQCECKSCNDRCTE